MSKPKVISLFKTEKFDSRFLNVPMIGEPVDLFVECISYELEIPVNGKPKKELDIFEETVLRMVALKKCSIDELSDILCLKKDMVNFILIRLNESGLLDNNQTISEKGNEILNKQMQIRTEVEYIQAKIFMIKKTGLILPYIHVGEFQSEDVSDFTLKTITLQYGSAGRPKNVRGRSLRNYDRECRIESVLNSRVVRKSISTFNKIAQTRHSSPIAVCDSYAISSSVGDSVFFHFQSAVQEGNVDELMFSDGFVSNVDGMMDYVQQENPQLLLDIKKRAVDMTISGEEGPKRVYKSHKYNEIHHLYAQTHEKASSGTYDGVTIDERQEINEGKKQIIINCYHMLEWGFYYYTKKNPLSDAILNLLSQRNAAENLRTLTQFASCIGIQSVNRCRNLLSHLHGKKIYYVYKHNSPTLYICLPLAIAEAKENSNSEIHTLVSKDDGFFRFLDDLNNDRGNLCHDARADAIEMDAAKILQETIRILSFILPDLNLENNNAERQIRDDASKARLIGQVSLEKKLGSIFFATMLSELKNEWLKISPDKRGEKLPESREYVEILYRILQTELAEANKEIKSKQQLTKEAAIKKLEPKVGTLLPRSLSRVGEDFYMKSTREEKSTLGAEALVYIANVDDRLFELLEKHQYIKVLDKVIVLRGHGDMVVLNETEQSLNELRDKVVELSKIVGGYYD